MQVNASLKNAKFYNVETFEIVLGEKFNLFIVDDVTGVKWFSDEDPVLSLDVNGNAAAVEATALGASNVLIMDSNFTILKTLSIKVVSAIVEPAKDLGLTADAAEPK